ncbi:ASCH domain-containing protein [Ralstonia sp. ASV6]|uniref:ASCH domain-containing protein n=1 Tax=Ralstonia sp. ASV6 TaxID=2795124 RepID=UPI0034D35192
MTDRVLTIPVKGVYFDQIKAGTKPHEYRETTAYWQKRLVGRTYDRIVLTRGYPKKDDAERRLTVPWRGYQVERITHPHFGAHPVEVFAIDVSGGEL